MLIIYNQNYIFLLHTLNDHKHMHTCAHAYTHTHARALTHTHTHARTHAHTHARTHAHTHTHTEKCSPYLNIKDIGG